MKTIKMYTTKVCPYCLMAKRLLAQKGVTAIEEIRMDLDVKLRDEMIQLTNRRTVPQIFIGDVHVGGFDDLVLLNKQGKLDELLQ